MYQNLKKRVWLFTIIFLPLKESLTLFQIGIFFATLLLILSHFELSRIELPKLTSGILMEIVTILVVLVDQFYFYMHHQPIKPRLFEKIIFWASLSLHFNMVLKSLVSY